MRWYALTVPYQHERQTEKALQSKGLETLVPLYRSRRQWSDRVKDVDLPLFAGYVPCHFDLSDRIQVLDTPGVAKIVGFGGAPAALEDSEMAAIQRVVAAKLPLAPWPYLKAGDRVRVEHGPLRKQDPGRFVGRIWVEDLGNSIVRSNGTYVPAIPSRRTPPARYFQFDSWRVNVTLDVWAPSQIYVEEPGSSVEGRPSIPRFKAQTRIWGYAAASSNKWDELTQILVDSGSQVEDHAPSKDLSPLESQRVWERQAEENVVARLEKSGLLAPSGPVDDVLNTVVNNLIVSANLNVEARCRVLLTTPLETFSIGHTIVISRGLIDVLPDEASLALVLADELSHIALGHRTPTQFAFRNQTMLTDAEMFLRLHFERTTPELEAAGKKTVEIMRASPYQKTANAGLFLKALGSRSSALPRLLAANLGNQLANPEALGRLAEFTASAPDLEESHLEQIAALPLGSRVKLDPWRDQITLVKTRPLELLSPREKMPFEITPFILYLTRSP
ncbi:MAG: M48 family metalloprotease [Acidobacteriia bacterium]|nr:M48 family metalloprotease [Terriglobia bacterium]